jgi:hypothetical protein
LLSQIELISGRNIDRRSGEMTDRVGDALSTQQQQDIDSEQKQAQINKEKKDSSIVMAAEQAWGDIASKIR